MRLPDPISKDERDARWWKGWRSVDFSWSSIASRSIVFDDNADTLQDYWLFDPVAKLARDWGDVRRMGELVPDPTGRLWHLVHVPLHWDDGTPTWKADRTDPNWARFWAIIAARLDAAAADDAYPAQFQGVVFGEPPEDWAWDRAAVLHAEFVSSAFTNQVSFAGVETADRLEFLGCLFAAFVDFDNLKVNGDLVFDHTAFRSTIWMKGVAVAGELRLDECDLHGELSLVQARIEGETSCDHCVFHAPCLFEGSVFLDEVQFSWCRFLNVVSFASVRFRGSATFLEDAFDIDVTFTGRCYGDFKCIGCRFAASTDFAFMLFRRETWFAESRFQGVSRFQAIRFIGDTSFLNAVFAAEVKFERVRFAAKAAFHNVIFEGRSDFTGCAFSSDARTYHGAFRGADFRRNADFTVDDFAAWGAFIDASFQQRLLLSRTCLNGDASFARAFAAARHAAEAEVAGAVTRRMADDRRFGELEAAFQALKQAMAAQQARLDEHRFYRFELLARSRTSASSRVERGIIRIYDLTSRCGTSFVRPLVSLLVLVLLFAVGYWAVSLSPAELTAALNPHPPRPVDARLIDAVRFSVENTIQPMSVWSKRFTESDPHEAWVRALLSPHGPAGYLAVRLVATLQSLASIALLFLVVLGFKRHFQMNT